MPPKKKPKESENQNPPLQPNKNEKIKNIDKKDEIEQPQEQKVVEQAQLLPLEDKKRIVGMDEEVEQFVSNLFYEQNLKKEMESLDLDVKKVFAETLEKDVENVLHVIQYANSPDYMENLKILKAIYEYYTKIPIQTKPNLSEIIPEFLRNFNAKWKAIQTIYSLTKVSEAIKTHDNPVRSVYETLAIELESLQMEDSDDILRYVSVSNFPKVQFKILQLFGVKQKKNTFVPISNNLLLWKGLTTSDLYGLLNHGHVGPNANFMYTFTPMFSEASKNLATDTNKRVFLGLAEVTLGQSYSTFVSPTSVPTNYDSVLVFGNAPNPQGNFLHKDGYSIPLGSISGNSQNGALYFVADPSQFRLKYILHVEIMTIAVANQNLMLPNHWFIQPKKCQWSYSSGFGWSPFTYEMNNFVEQQYQSGVTKFSILMGFFHYDLNLESFTMVRRGYQGNYPLQRMIV